MGLSIILEKLKQRFWVLPALITIAILGVFILTVSWPNPEVGSVLDKILPSEYSAGGARLILSSAGTALMTVVGVLFSITVVVLQQVSSQYSPRVIESFIRSRPSQMVLGFYVGTFVFCLLLLGQVRNDSFPQVAIVTALVFVLICIALLISYIHHIVHAIQSTYIISTLRDETLKYLAKYSEFLALHQASPDILAALPSEFSHSYDLYPCKSGYLQSLDFDPFEKRQFDRLVQVHLKIDIGNYVDVDFPVAVVSSDRPISEDDIRQFEECFNVGSSRTHVQDFGYGIRQMVDIALRALSPGINDPSTAREAINAVGTVLFYFTKHCRWPMYTAINPMFIVRFQPMDFKKVLAHAFAEVLVVGREQPMVLQAVLKILDQILQLAQAPDAQALDRQEAAGYFKQQVDNLYQKSAGQKYFAFSARQVGPY